VSEEHSCGCPFGSPRIAGVWRLQSSRSGPNGQPPERPQLTSPVHQGERGATVNTIAQGMPDDLAALLLLACVKCVFHARKAHGCGLHPAFPAPSVLSRANDNAQLGHFMPRERCHTSLRAVGWAKAHRAVPAIYPQHRPRMVGTLRFAHHNSGSPAFAGDDTELKANAVIARRRGGDVGVISGGINFCRGPLAAPGCVGSGCGAPPEGGADI